jgi:nucleoside-diphosphate-sugar epimerase
MGASTSRRILVTGAGGFVGAGVVHAAQVAGHHPIALVRTPDAARLAGLDIPVHVADLSDNDRVSAVLHEAKPDVVVHTAWEGVSGSQRAGDVQFENIRTACALADSAVSAGASRFVGIGSQAEYGRLDRRIVETDLPNPSMLYGAAKLAACHLVRQRCEAAGVGFAWIRLFAAYGPGDNPNWLIPSVAAELLAGRAPRTSPGTQLWDYLHIDDVATGTLTAAVSDDASGVYNLCSGEPATIRSIIERLRDHAAPGLPLRFGDIPFGSSQIMHLEGDIGRLGALGWSPAVSLDTGLAQTVDWMRSHRKQAA